MKQKQESIFADSREASIAINRARAGIAER